MSPELEGRFLTTGPPGKPPSVEKFSATFPTHTSREGRGAGDRINLQWPRFNQLCLDNEPSIKNPKEAWRAFPVGKEGYVHMLGGWRPPGSMETEASVGQDPSGPLPVYLYLWLFIRIF